MRGSLLRYGPEIKKGLHENADNTDTGYEDQKSEREGPHQDEVQGGEAQMDRAQTEPGQSKNEIQALYPHSSSTLLTPNKQIGTPSPSSVVLFRPGDLLLGPFQLTSALMNDYRLLIPDWEYTTLNDVFSRRAFKTLPPKSDTFNLINKAFQYFHTALPIFDRVDFMKEFGERYFPPRVSDSCSDAAWWASINVVLAFAHRFRAMHTLKPHSEDREAWGYLQNALTVITELTLCPSSLLAVQALLGMAILVQATSNPGPCGVLVATAMRLAQSMGLHRQEQKKQLSVEQEAQREQRQSVFWIAYSLDKEISIRTGQPPSQDEEDMDVELPAEMVNLDKQTEGRVIGANIFNLKIGLAIIQGKIYKRLCSMSAQKLSTTERLVSAQELEVTLEEWKTGVPIDFGATFLGTEVLTEDLPALLHMAIIRLSYLKSLDVIRRYLTQITS